VCGYERADGTRDVVVQKDHAGFFLAWTERLLAERTPLVGHNVAAFDFCVIAADAYERHGPDVGDTVMRRIFDMLDAGLVEDTMLRERLIDLAEGTMGRDFSDVTKEGKPRRKSYGLKALAKRYLDVDLDKTSWRTGYAALDGVPLDEWPQGARDYVIDDVNVARRVADAPGVYPTARSRRRLRSRSSCFRQQVCGQTRRPCDGTTPTSTERRAGSTGSCSEKG
jgi:hypothetical protein